MSTWTRSSACSMGTCVEVRHVAGHVEVRDTDPDTVLHITPADWAAFLVGAKAGEFDGPAADTAPARETGADWAARPRRSSPEDALSVRERLGTAEPVKQECQAEIWPSWASSWVTCGAPVRDGECVKYGHEQGADTAPGTS